MNIVTKTFYYGDQKVTLETGRIARQAHGAVLVTVENSLQILVTVVGNAIIKEDQTFFPLSVHYQEKFYSVGKIPGGFFKREMRPSEKETITSRLIDRSLRPLFPKDFMHEVQVICTVLSSDRTQDPDIFAMIGASAAVSISGLPLLSIIGSARVAYTELGGYQLNPNYLDLLDSEMDMVVAGTKKAVSMVESDAKELTEDQMLGAILFAHHDMQCSISAIEEFGSMVMKPNFSWRSSYLDICDELVTYIEDKFSSDLANIYKIFNKQKRNKELHLFRTSYLERLELEKKNCEL
jgi:polyribonucleotide nucleotidyltransferase